MQNRGMDRHSIAQVFVFLLLGVFAVFSTLMVLLGAQLYRETVNQTERHGERRILFSYLSNVVRSNDMGGHIYVDQRDGIDMLVMSLDVDGETYETMVYVHEGMLKELFISAEQTFEPGYGEQICSAQAFSPEIRNGLLEIRLKDAAGQEDMFHIALRCSQEGADE